ncbi:4Fe-4S dicluster domain-containing protein [bacterium]
MKKVIIREKFCKACGLCINICPDKALEFDKKFNQEGYHPVKWKCECRLCGLCYLVCPDAAIEVKEDE